MNLIGQIITVVRKDLLLEWRGKGRAHRGARCARPLPC